MAPEQSAGVLSSVSKCKKAGMCLVEKCRVLEKRRSGLIFSAVAGSSVLTSQQYVILKVSLSRNIPKITLCSDGLIKML